MVFLAWRNNVKNIITFIASSKTITSPRSFPNLDQVNEGMNALQNDGDLHFVISYCELQVARNDPYFLIISG